MARRGSVYTKTSHTLRESLGLTQVEYAAFCNISPSVLGMIETNRREWPLGKGLEELPLVLAYAKSEKEPLDLSAWELPDPKSISRLERRLLEITGLQYRLENELKRMDYFLKTGRHLLQTCQYLRRDHAEAVAGKLNKIEYWEHLAANRIQENLESLQSPLRLQLRHLGEEEALLKETLKTFSRKDQ